MGRLVTRAVGLDAPIAYAALRRRVSSSLRLSCRIRLKAASLFGSFARSSGSRSRARAVIVLKRVSSSLLGSRMFTRAVARKSALTP